MNERIYLSTTANVAEYNSAVYNVDRTSRKAKPSLTDADDGVHSRLYGRWRET